MHGQRWFFEFGSFGSSGLGLRQGQPVTCATKKPHQIGGAFEVSLVDHLVSVSNFEADCDSGVVAEIGGCHFRELFWHVCCSVTGHDVAHATS